MTGLLASAVARRAGAVLAPAGLAAILYLTLRPTPEQAPYAALTPLLCLVCGDHGASDVILNLLLFAPMAVGLRLLGWPWSRVVAACAALSLAVESLQYFVVPGRDASLSDLITNTAGGALAAGIAGRLPALLLPDPALARRLTLNAALLWLGVLAASAVALMPWAPGGRIRNECTRAVGKPDPFSGTARSVVMNGVTLRCDELVPDPKPVRAALDRGEFQVDLVALSAHPARGRTLIQALRGRGEFLLLLASDRRSAVFSAPTASLRVRLYAPILRLKDAFPDRKGVPVQLHAGTRDRRMWIGSDYGGTQQRAEVALSPAHGWSTLLPLGIRRTGDLRIATLLWLVGLTLPLAYWAGRTGRPALAAAGLAAVLAAGLALLPALTGYPPCHWTEWAGGALGVGAGWALHRIAAYLQSRCGSPSISAFSSS